MNDYNDKYFIYYTYLNKKEIYSMLLQVIIMIYLMRKHNYTHNDLHGENIGANKLDVDKVIKFKNKDIYLRGYQYYCIDYGLVLNPIFNLSKDEEKKFKKNYKHEINKILSRLVYFEKPTIKKLIPYEFNKDLYKRIKNNDNFVKLNDIKTQLYYLDKNGKSYKDFIEKYSQIYKDKYSEYSKSYVDQNRDKLKEYKHECYEQNKENCQSDASRTRANQR